MSFADLVGHERLQGLLETALRERRLPPAMLFVGPEGVGKRTLALAVGRGLLCVEGPGIPCERCPPCRRAQRGLHPDFTVVSPEGDSIKIERIRDAIREVQGRPFEAAARMLVIDDAHAMTEQAENALLKSLEEPPATSHIALVTALPQALLPTIRSRCQVLRLGSLPSALLESHLVEARGLDAEEARLRSRLCGGSLGAALAFQADAYRGLRDEVLEVLESLGRGSVLARMEAAERLSQHDDLALTLVALRSLLRDLNVVRAGGEAETLINGDVAPRLAPLAAGPLGARATELAEQAGEIREALVEQNANKLLSMDVLLDAMATPLA